MDPFQKLPEEIFDQILKHFEIDEILSNLSFVSLKWYETIGKSNICMQKIKVNLRSKRKNDFAERIETLNWMSKKNSRKYLFMQVNCLFDENISRAYYNFLASSHSIETLNVRSMKMKPCEELVKLSLPKLEFLKVMFIPRVVINNLITSSTNLRRLILWNEEPLSYDDLNYLPTEETIENVRQCMLNNAALEELEIQGRANFFSFFQQDISLYVKCHLKKLTVKIEMKPQLLTEEQETNFINFLKSQADSLEYVYVDSFGTNVIKQVFNEMPNLKTIRFDITLDGQNRFDVKELGLRINENVTNFELPYVKLFDDLKDFLTLVPNASEILIMHIIPRVLDFVTVNLPKLESLIYRYDDCAGGCDQVYENMKKNTEEINQNIKLSICNDFM